MRRAAAALAVAVAACACTHPAAVLRPQARPSVNVSHHRGLWLGYAGPATGLKGFTAATGAHPNMISQYVQPEGRFIPPHAGVTPFVSLATTRLPAEVLAGAEDKALTAFGHELAAYRKQVVVSIDPEGNGPWYSYGTQKATAAQYVAVYRHVRAVLLASGASNALWAWTVSNSPPITHTPLLHSLYPGDAYTDLIGVDGYFIGSENSWQQVFARVFSRVRSFTRKPFLIAETSVKQGPQAAAWTGELFAGVESTPGVLGLIWFNWDKSAVERDDWRLEDDPAALAAFRAAVKEYG